ncbi:secondary thiamine-phosphate synthase enzyme YjbQ [Vallitalea guaymasensis]|uniref:secondary thiamine-phosphate synthase enzyme YjbQ n=1 Tax=Vallitalea guaymasensis TaxID=1185412 RepID=UPI00272D6225|nr:secondary thiamine-phosphate synthase enzyme YjbQ [Vallitalea guaymasensis]
MITKMIQVKTNKHVEMIDITSKVQNIIESEGVEDGICTVFIPHTTAGVTINENADPDVTRDMLMEMNKIVPLEDGYRHMEGNSAAHIKSSMMGFSETIIIKEGRLLLGTWQGIYFCEFDGPRNRKTMINIIIEK